MNRFCSIPLAATCLLVTARLSAAPAPARPATPPATPPAAAAPGTAARPAPIWSLAFSPDGKTLAAGTYRKIQLYDLDTKMPTHAITGSVGAVRCLSWNADGTLLACGGGKPGEAGEVRIWKSTGEPVVTLSDHKDVVEGVAFAPGGNAVVSASEDEKALAVDMTSRKVIRAMGDHTNRVVSISVSPNGKYIATGSLDKTIKIWDATDFKPLANLDFDGGKVYAVAFLPDGNSLLAGGEDGNVRIYRLTESRTGKLSGLNGQLARAIGGNRTAVFAIGTAAKTGAFAYGGQDKTVTLFDKNGNGKTTLRECTDAVYAVAMSPDGSLVAAGCRDGKVRLWSGTDGKLITEWGP